MIGSPRDADHQDLVVFDENDIEAKVMARIAVAEFSSAVKAGMEEHSRHSRDKERGLAAAMAEFDDGYLTQKGLETASSKICAKFDKLLSDVQQKVSEAQRKLDDAKASSNFTDEVPA